MEEREEVERERRWRERRRGERRWRRERRLKSGEKIGFVFAAI